MTTTTTTMTTTNTSAPRCPPTLIDEDIQHTVDDVLKASINIVLTTNNNTTTNNNINSSDKDWKQQQQQGRLKQQQQQQQRQQVTTELYGYLIQSLTAVMQAERNGWKDKLHTTLQEVDRQRKASIAEQAHLQEFVEQLGIMDIPEPYTDGKTGAQTLHLISALRSYIQDLQDCGIHSEHEDSLQGQLNNMHNTLAQLQRERSEHLQSVQQKTSEILWLQKELNSIKHQMQKLQKVILNYNESHSTKFHLDDVHTPKDTGKDSTSRERTYVEGDQMDFASTPAEEVALWKAKLRLKGDDDSGCKTKSRAGISQCLRCQKLFKASENNARACRYHHKGREIKEQYDPTGRLARVLYKWACCKKAIDVHGCTYGFHI